MFDYFRYNTHGLLNLAAALFDISVGLIVLLQNPKSKINQSFFYLTLNTGIWLLGFGLISLTRDPHDAMLWMSLDYVLGVPFIPVSFYLLSSNLLERTDNKFQKILGVIWAMVITLPMVFYTDRIVTPQEHSWGRYISFQSNSFSNSYFAFLIIPFCGLLVASFINFYRAWKSAVSPKEKVRMRNILIGVLIAYTGSCDFLTARQFPVYPSGYITLTIFIGIVSYTIVRYQFFEFNVLLRKFSVIFLIYSFLLAFTIPAVSFLLNSYFPAVPPSQLWPLLGLSFLVGAVLSIGPLIYAAILRRSFWLRQQSATGLTHELKSPLATIQSANQFLLDYENSPNRDKSKAFEYLHMVERNAARLELFVQDLLSVAKIQNEDIDLQKTQLDLAKLMKEVAETYSLLAIKKDVTIHLEANSLPPVEADQKKIQLVLSNLISNSLKFTEKGTIHITARLSNKSIICTVRDTGKGIPTKDLERVFDRFYHGKHSNKGSGLGLTIAKAWVEAHGGKIWAESDGEGKGTKITFTLPLHI